MSGHCTTTIMSPCKSPVSSQIWSKRPAEQHTAMVHILAHTDRICASFLQSDPQAFRMPSVEDLPLCDAMWCRAPNHEPPALPHWKLEEPDSPKIDHDLDGDTTNFHVVLCTSSLTDAQVVHPDAWQSIHPGRLPRFGHLVLAVWAGVGFGLPAEQILVKSCCDLWECLRVWAF